MIIRCARLLLIPAMLALLTGCPHSNSPPAPPILLSTMVGTWEVSNTDGTHEQFIVWAQNGQSLSGSIIFSDATVSVTGGVTLDGSYFQVQGQWGLITISLEGSLNASMTQFTGRLVETPIGLFSQIEYCNGIKTVL